MLYAHSHAPAWRPVGTRLLLTVLLLTGVITTAHSQTESTFEAQEHQITGTMLPNGVGIDIAGIDPILTPATRTYAVSAYVVTVTPPSGWQLRRVEQDDPGDGPLWRWILASDTSDGPVDVTMNVGEKADPRDGILWRWNLSFDTSKGPVDLTVDVGALLMHEGIQLVARESGHFPPPVLRVQNRIPRPGLNESTLLIIGLSWLVIVLTFRAGRAR